MAAASFRPIIRGTVDTIRIARATGIAHVTGIGAITGVGAGTTATGIAMVRSGATAGHACA